MPLALLAILVVAAALAVVVAAYLVVRRWFRTVRMATPSRPPRAAPRGED